MVFHAVCCSLVGFLEEGKGQSLYGKLKYSIVVKLNNGNFRDKEKVCLFPFHVVRVMVVIFLYIDICFHNLCCIQKIWTESDNMVIFGTNIRTLFRSTF